MNSRGLELSIGMVVLLIISTVSLIGGIALVKNFFSQAEQVRDQLDSNVLKGITDQLIISTELTTIPFNKQTINRGKIAKFGLGVRNMIGSDKLFCVSTSFVEGFQPSEEKIGARFGTQDYDSAYIQENWVGGFALQSLGKIRNNEVRSLPLLIGAGNLMADGVATVRGTYHFNVCVFTVKNDSDCFSSGKRAVCADCAQNPGGCPSQIDRRPDNFVYGGHVLPVYVEVV